MIGDLISRNALLKVFQEDKEFLQKGLSKDSEYAYMSADSVIEKIKSMPTAYDMDKVVKELEDLRDFKANQFNTSKFGLMQMVIDFVKSGRIE